jgi:D-sedoheptulose 7-phosphate isomerase
MTVAMDRALRVETVIAEAIRAHELARATAAAPVVATVDALLAAFGRHGKALIFGNGGSATDALHFAAELVGRFERRRRAVGAIALAADTSVLTAVANDYGYEQVFARQIEALGAPGDVAIAISTSGDSPNVLGAINAARARAMTTVGFTGNDGGAVGRTVAIHVNVPHASTARVQEVHRTLIHAVCELVEREL